ncbi:MAG: cation diffusion facilitator family transporter [Pirellulales bacterium]
MHVHSHGSHDHSHAPADYGRAFAIGTAINLGFVVVEAVYGFAVDSLALLADAGHNLGDVLGLLLAWGATVLAKRRPTPQRTYGLRRSSIVAALLNAALLLVAVGGIGWEALHRFWLPEPPPSLTVAWVAGIGILVNGGTALLFFGGRHADANIRGAYLHMAADAAVSAGVVVAALVIWRTGWMWLDPAVALVIAVVIFWSGWDLLRKALDLSVDAVPRGIDAAAVRAFLLERPGVRDAHDLHIWGMSTTEAALTVHLVMPQDATQTDAPDRFLAETARALHDRFGIEHATIQIERGDDGCCPCDASCDPG